MLDFLALALEANKEHNKEMPDVSAASSRGFMLNLSAVLLRGCEPFLDPRSGKAWGRLDYRSVDCCTADISCFRACVESSAHHSPSHAWSIKAYDKMGRNSRVFDKRRARCSCKAFNCCVSLSCSQNAASAWNKLCWSLLALRCKL